VVISPVTRSDQRSVRLSLETGLLSLSPVFRDRAVRTEDKTMMSNIPSRWRPYAAFQAASSRTYKRSMNEAGA